MIKARLKSTKMAYSADPKADELVLVFETAEDETVTITFPLILDADIEQVCDTLYSGIKKLLAAEL